MPHRLPGAPILLFPVTMTEENLAAALARLERAIARVEMAYGNRENRRNDITADYNQLDERHTALRAKVEQTIAQLDAMIGAD